MKGKVPGLIKRIIAALSSKTDELRTRIMIFFLLHSNKTLLIDRMHTIVGGPNRRHAHRNAGKQSLRYGNKKKANDEHNDEHNDDGDDVSASREGEGESFIMYMNREAAPAQMGRTMDTVMEPSRTGTEPEQVFAYTQDKPEVGYTDLTHALFKESEEEMEITDIEDGVNNACKDGRGSALMNKMLAIFEDNSERLDEEAGEEDIDHAADLFIERFRRQIRLQKQQSLQERHHKGELLQQYV